MGLIVRNVSKSFGDKKAVDHIGFEMVEPGVFGLIGTNGAGKTTTIRMILGVMQKDEGEISWNDVPIRRDTVRYGYMPEERGIYPKIKVIDQLIYFAELRGMNRKDATEAAEKWLSRLGVTEYRNMPAEKLSKGNQQKIQLIAAIIHDPELIFLDEPFSGLDPVNTDVFKSVIGELIENHKYIVMSSHQMATVEEYCHNLLMLDKGHTVLQGNLREIKAGYGHTNLSVGCASAPEKAVLSLAEKHGLKLIQQMADGYEFKISGDESAHGLLKEMIDGGFFPERYEIREPSLHEIFIEKVGAAQ